MDCIQIVNETNFLTDIIVPLLSALIGGGITLIGVWLTLRNERKKQEKTLINQYKPLFYFRNGNNTRKDQIESSIVINNNDDYKYRIFGIIQNTDKSIFQLDGVYVNDELMKPEDIFVIDKGKCEVISIYLKKKVFENVRSIKLSIVDSINYIYEVPVSYKRDDDDIIITSVIDIKGPFFG